MSTLNAIIMLSFLAYGAHSICPSQCSCASPEPEVVSVSCVSASLGSVPIFLNPSTTSLDLRDNKVRRLEGALHLYTQLHQLDLSRNRLSHLGRNQFEQQKALNSLNISNNLIGALHPHTFRGLEQLHLLDLSFNGLNMIAANSFLGLHTLLELNLNNNEIRSLNNDALVGLRRLRILNLAGNQLHSLRNALDNQRFLANVASLKSLNLSRNNFVDLEDDALCGSVSLLETLDLSHNQMENLGNFSFRGCRDIDTIHLDNNQLEKVPSLALSQLNKLAFLDFSTNPVEILSRNSLKALFELRELRLNNMSELRSIDEDAFLDVVELRRLELNNNSRLGALPWGLLDNQRELEHLGLRKNAFPVIFPQQIGLNANLQTLDLSESRLNCNCSLIWLHRLYNHSRIKLSSEIFCKSIGNNHLHSLLRLEEVREQQLTCSGSHWSSEAVLMLSLALIIVLMTLFVTMVIVGVMRLRRRRRGDCGYIKDDTIVFSKTLTPMSRLEFVEQASCHTQKNALDDDNFLREDNNFLREDNNFLREDNVEHRYEALHGHRLYWPRPLLSEDLALTARRVPTRFVPVNNNLMATVPRYSVDSSPCSSASTNMGTLSSSSNGSSDISRKRKQQHLLQRL